MANIDLQNRSPRVERLPDDRLRVSRIYDVINAVAKTPAELTSKVWLAWGTADAVFTDCRLVGQFVSGQEGSFREPCVEPPILTRVYEQIDRNSRTQVGDPAISYDQYGNKTVVLEYVQFSDGSTTYADVVGTSAAPAPNAACILKSFEAPNDGTLIRWKLTYIDKGQLSDTEQIKFNGKLLVREITYLNEIPPTPAGYTLITESTEFIEGLPVYRYGFANGSGGGGGGGATGGVISTDIQYNMSPDQGTTGVTVQTIQFISAPSVTINPIETPLGYELIEVKYDDEDGYRLWTAKYAFGQGIISSDTDIRSGGNLIIYSITSINAIPDDPLPTIDGTVTLIKSNERNGTDAANGTIIYDYQWAEGNGEIERTTDYQQSSDEGSTGVTRVTIRHLTALGDTDPTTAPGVNYAKISSGSQAQDGYLVWTVVYAIGVGVVSTETETKNGGKLILYRQTELYYTDGLTPTTPSATIGGTVTLVSEEIRNADGYFIYLSVWAEGNGEVGRDIDYLQSTNAGTTGVTRVTIRHLTALGASNPTTAPAANYVQVSISSQAQDGYLLWNVVWAIGAGIVSSEVEQKNENKLVIYRQTELSYNTAYVPTAPAATIGGTVTFVSREKRNADGYFIFNSVWAEGNGIITSEVETKNGTSLKLYRRTELNGSGAYTPATPTATISGTVTLVSQDIRNQDGYFLYASVWAEGKGEISVDVDYSQSSDAGTTGVTRTTYRWLTAIGAADPTTAPGGTVLISSSAAEQDGYLLWTVIYAKGVGTVTSTIDIREGGELVIYRIIALGAAPSAPTPTTGGTVTSIATSVREDSGYQVFDYQWAEGNGLVSTEVRYEQSADAGTTGATITTFRWLTALGAVDPTSAPSGTVKVSSINTNQDGYLLWVVTYAKGAGTVLSSNDIREGGKLVIYRRVALKLAPSTPAATIGGTVTPISTSERNDSGWVVYDYQWAEGFGDVSVQVEYLQSADSGTTGITRTTYRALTALGATDPTTAPGGSVKISSNSTAQEGYLVWVVSYAKGTGTVESSLVGREDGSLVYTITDLGSAVATPAYPGAGTAYLTSLNNEQAGGYWVNRATYIKPPATVTYKKLTDFSYPGLATLTTGAVNFVTLAPPVTRRLLADEEVSFSTSQDTTAPWTLEFPAYLNESFTIRLSATETAQPQTTQQALGGYVSSGASGSGSEETYNQVLCAEWETVIAASSPTTRPTGSTVLSVDNDPYLTTTAGVQVFRRRKMTYTF